MFWDFLMIMFNLIGQIIGKLNAIILSDGIVSAGFFSLMIGFVVLDILLSVLLNQGVN